MPVDRELAKLRPNQAAPSLQLVQQAGEAQGRGQDLRASLWHKLETYYNFLVVSHFNS